jgi:hypothetical protein
MTTAGAAKSREPHRHRAKQRRYPMKSPVFDVTRMTARQTGRTQNRVIVGLNGDYSLLQARQVCFASASVSPRFAISPRSPRGLISSTSTTRDGRSISVSTKRKTHVIHQPPRQQSIGGSYRLGRYPPTFWTFRLVAELAASAKEQATGLGEVNAAVNQVDQATPHAGAGAAREFIEGLIMMDERIINRGTIPHCGWITSTGAVQAIYRRSGGPTTDGSGTAKSVRTAKPPITQSRHTEIRHPNG